MIRARFNLEKGDEKATLFEESKKFYDSLVPILQANRLTVDIFGFATDQFGLSEMKNLVSKTGGVAVVQEEFVQ